MLLPASMQSMQIGRSSLVGLVVLPDILDTAAA